VISKLYAGIDISATDATLCCLDSEGNQLKPSQKFENNLSGAAQLVEALTEFEAEEIHVGLESTSVYGAHLRDFFLASPLLQGKAFVYELNPALVSGFKRSFPKKPKTDNLDAYFIAERIRFGHLRPFSEKQLTTQPLLQLTRYRLHLIKLLTTLKISLCHFHPSAGEAKLHDRLWSKTGLVTLCFSNSLTICRIALLVIHSVKPPWQCWKTFSPMT